MATIKQGVDYEITASDKTAQATDSVMKRIDEMREKEKAAAKERKAESEAHQAEVQKSRGLVQAMGAAASGSWHAVAKGLGVAALGVKKFNAAMMKFGPYAAIVAGVVMAVKALAGAFASAREAVEKIQFDNIKNGIESSKKRADAFAAALDQAKAKQESLADAVDRQLESTKALRDAQDDYNKALELSVAKSEEERRSIEEKYAILKSATAEETASKKRENDRKRLDADIANMEERLASERENLGYSRSAYSRLEGKAWRAAQKIGYGNSFLSWFAGTESAGDESAKLYEAARAANEQIKAGQAEIAKLETAIADAKNRRRHMDEEEAAARESMRAAKLANAQKRAADLAESDVADYERWRSSGSGETFAVWRRNDARAGAAKIALREKQYREWMKEMGREAPETVGGAAFGRFVQMKEAEEAAAAKAEAERRAAEEQRAAEEARTRETERAEEERERIRKAKIDAAAEYQAAKDAASANQRIAAAEAADADARLAAAKSAVAVAWGWYRDKDSLKAQLDEEKADAAAQVQFEKDFGRLKSRSDWRTAKNLSLDQEAVRRVAIAREEEAAAREYAKVTAEASKRAADSLEAIEAAFNEGGE